MLPFSALSFALRLLLLAAFVGTLAAQSPLTSTSSAVPPNLVTEGIPPIPPELKADVAHYLTLGGASFRGWSTSRRSVIVTTRSGNAVQICTVGEPLGKRTRLTQGSEPVTNGWFQPRGGKWFVFGRDSKGDEQYQFYALDATRPGSKPILLTDGVSRNTDVRWSPDGQLLAYASTRRDGKDNDIYVVDPMNPASTRCLLQNKSPSWDVECWNHNATKILLRHGVSDTKTELWSVDVRSGEKTLLTWPDDTAFLDRPRFAEDDTAIYAMGYDHSDFLMLLRLDLKTGRHEPLTEHIKWDLENFEISPDGDTVAFVTNEDGFGRLHLLDAATHHEMPVPRIPGDLINDLSWREGSRELGFTLSSSQSPTDAWSLEVDSQRLTRWTNRRNPSAMKEVFAEPEIVHVTASDGVPISSLVYRPDPERFPGKRPVVISIHGGPTSQSRPGFRGASNYYLNQEGIALVYPNVRGSSGYGLKFAKLDDGFAREAAVADIGAVITWIQRDPRLDPDRIAVMGGSYGGFMTLASLVKYRDILKCGVDSVGIANFITFLHDTSDYRRDNRRSEYGDERKKDMHDFLEKISPANHAAEIRAPLMIVQGKNDPRVPVTEAEQMRDAIRAHGGTVWYLLATDEGHGFHKKANSDFEFCAAVMFFREYLLK